MIARTAKLRSRSLRASVVSIRSMKIWNGRFRGRMNPEALKFSTSLQFDQRLFREDIEGSIAHIRMLSRQKIISERESTKIQKALRSIQREIEQKKLDFSKASRGGDR